MSDALCFNDQVVIVIGIDGGLGRTRALLFTKHDVRVVVNDLGGSTHGEGASASAVDKVVAEIRAAGGTAVANHDSVTDGGRIVENALDAFGRVGVVVSNTGTLRDKTSHKMGDANWGLVYQMHVKDACKATCVTQSHLREQTYGRVVFTSSTSGIYGSFGQSNYGMVKLGLYGLTRILVLEERKSNILINAIVPTGGMWMTEGLIPSQVPEQLKPELVGPLMVYLGSSVCEDTSGFYEVDGGWIDKVCREHSLGFGFDPKVGFNAKDVATHWQQICDFKNAAHPADNVEMLHGMMANLQKYVF